MNDDLISRQAAIDAISVYANRYKKYIGKPNDSEVYAYSRGLIASIEMSINALPSTKPPPETCWGCNCQKMEKAIRGKWVQVNHNERECSLCGNRELWMNTAVYEFCPHCGAKMEVPE